VLVDRLKPARGVDGVVLATSTHPENDPLVDAVDVPVFRGDEDDVLRRYVETARHFGADHVVRVTGDNPLTDLETLERLVDRHHAERSEYTYVPGDALLMGILSEVISTEALVRSWDRGEPRHRSELMTLYVKEHPSEFRIRTANLPEGLYRPQYRLTVDEPEDVKLMQAIFERLGPSPTTRQAIELLDREPALGEINAAARHKAGNLRSVALDAAVVASQGGPR
jgi:spore coat polysaccharide biosynthesis protein SpsF